MARIPQREVGLVVLAIVGISASAPLAASIAAPAVAIAFWRNAMASAVLWGQRAVTGTATRMSRRDFANCVIAGIFLAGHFGLWIPSLSMTSVAASTALVCTAPLWSGFIARVTGTRISGRTWVGVAVALSGVVVISGVDLNTSATALAGDALAFGGGACMAGYLAAGEHVRRRVDTVSYTVTCYSTAAVVLLLVCVVSGDELFAYSATAWGLLVALTVCGQLLGHSLLNRSLRWLPGTTVATLTLLEVPGAALLAAAFLGQLPGLAIWAGIALILSGLWLTVRGRTV